MSESNEDRGMRNVYTLGLVSLFTDVSSEMVFSILPIFILGLPGGNRALLGLIEGTAEALSYALRAVSGYFSDRFRKRKVVVLAGYTLSNLVKPLFAAAGRALDAFVIRVVDRVGKGVRTAPRDALISESVTGSSRGVAFGLHRTLDQLGAVLGPSIASAAMLLIGLTARDVFWLSFIPGSIALLILLFLVEERIGKAEGDFQLFKGLRRVLTREYSLFLCVVGLFSLGAFNFSFILLNASELGVIDPLIPIVYAVVNITHTAIGIPAGMLSDRIGGERVLAMGYGVFLSTALLIILSPNSLPAAYIIAATFGLYMGIVETVQRALIPGYAESGLRGTAYGVYYLVVGIAFFLANSIIGIIWEAYSSAIAVTYSVASSTLAIAAMLIFLKALKK